MSKLFEDSDSDIEIKTNNEYAKSYDTWRKKEELNKFKARHGEHVLDLENEDEEDTSDDDEMAVELTQEVEKDFYKTLALLKKNDPSIYDDKVTFFKESYQNDKSLSKPKKEKKMFLKDYERELLLEKGGIESDSENDEVSNVNLRKEEEMSLKDSFKVLDDSDEDIGSLLKAREQTKEEKIKEEEDYKAWLIGQEKKLKDKETASSLKPLRDFWNNENLEDGEKFLRDYLLNNRYLEKEDKNYIPTYNEIIKDLSEDESVLDKQEEFEHKYNFRFEEPDQEFIKRYPRTIEGSLRREDNKRKLKRLEVKERKAKEKEEKMSELKKLREIKRKEIEEKIEKLKDITGNKEIAFKDEDIEGDFDPEEHDKRMQALFNEEYYQDGPEEDVKPPIDLDDEDALELQPENYDNWTGPHEEEETNAPHCEDDDFNMDADYDPKATQMELVEISRRKKKRKRKSKFVEMLAKERPKFDPLNKSYEKYVDEYYKFDCEDIIDDIPCKFKYRKVAPNSFGLSVEEILMANDRELNKWCSLKKAVSLRDEQVEKYEQKVYEKKGQNITLKKKIIPSLFVDEEKKEENIPEIRNQDSVEQIAVLGGSPESPKKKMKLDENETIQENNIQKKSKKSEKTKKIKSVHKKVEKKERSENSFSDQTVSQKNDELEKEQKDKNHGASSSATAAHNENRTVKRRKDKKKNKSTNGIRQEETSSPQKGEEIKQKKVPKSNKGTKRKLSGTFDSQKLSKKSKKKSNKIDIGISDSRIACFGWNPKKFKNKLIYGNKNEN